MYRISRHIIKVEAPFSHIPGLRLDFLFLDLGFLSKPVVLGGVVASIRLYVFELDLLRF